MSIRTKMSPPWVVVIHEIEALFDGDPQIACNVDFSSETPTIVLACNDGDKVAALTRILPAGYQFGNVTLNVSVDGTPSNRAFKNNKELFEVAFAGNPAFAYAVTPGEDTWYIQTTYVVFKNCVVQFFADNLNDCHGIISTLYQNIAEELFGETVNGVYFNTDVEVGNLGKPLGEWP